MVSIQSAVEKLSRGDVMILPSDTLYGLATNAYNFAAVSEVFSLKKRDINKPLPVHYYSMQQIEEDCEISEEASNFMVKYWPGPLTIVLKKKSNSKLVCLADSVAVRIPKCQILLDILNLLNAPLVMPSANISGEPNIFNFAELTQLFPLEGIEANELLLKSPSTIISFVDGPMKVIREGVIKL